MASGGDTPVGMEELFKNGKKLEIGLEIKYFVLNPWKDNSYGVASRRAMMIYADSINDENRTLAKDIIEFVRKVNESLILLKGSKLKEV